MQLIALLSLLYDDLYIYILMYIFICYLLSFVGTYNGTKQNIIIIIIKHIIPLYVLITNEHNTSYVHTMTA